jgi:hypothetical protein
LIGLLERDYPMRMHEMIFRALTVPDAHDVAYEPILRLYRASDTAF